MGFVSLILAVAGIVTTIVHYTNHSIVLGIVSAVLLIVSFIAGTVDMKKQEKNGGIRSDMFNPGMLGHGMSSVVLIVCGIMCAIANIR
ncbi:MAG: hypothetical protein ACI3XQ_05715 [Eubacteriales bacterium]